MSSNPPPSSPSPEERERLWRAFPGEYRDGLMCGFSRHFPGQRDGGFPRGFHRWPREKRNAWFAGFDAGFHDWLSGRYPQVERTIRRELERRERGNAS
jgi:hypothetical protein